MFDLESWTPTDRQQITSPLIPMMMRIINTYYGTDYTQKELRALYRKSRNMF